MHDPLVVVFEIRRPWPRRDPAQTRAAALTGARWRLWGAFWTVAGHGLYWPNLITVWHRDPSGYDTTTCSLSSRGWRWHIHHWRLQVRPLQTLRRRVLTRCAWCGGRDRRGDRVDFALHAGRERAPWWRGETGLFHSDCSAIKIAHATCVCTRPVLEYDTYGFCARCRMFRPFGITDATLARRREQAEIPPGSRISKANRHDRKYS